MGSSGKKKTTMAKLAREHRLRERRSIKEAKKEARKQVASDQVEQVMGDPLDEAIAERTPPGVVEPPASAGEQVRGEPSGPHEKDAALERLRDASDEELAVFETNLRADALGAGATESEMRAAQRDHPGHPGQSPAAT